MRQFLFSVLSIRLSFAFSLVLYASLDASLAFSSPALADSPQLLTAKCSVQKAAGHEIKFCYEAGSPSSSQVVYYFHGIGADEKRWENSRVRIALDEHLVRSPGAKPHVFSISFGRAWFFTDGQSATRASRLVAFLTNAMPTFEATLPLPISRRILVGESMGGYNALRLAMEAPAMFQQVISLCPALLPVGPYSPKSEIDAFKQRNREFLDVRRLETIRWWAMTEFPNQESWTRNNPLDRSTLPVNQLPPLFLAQNTQDQYAFPEGTTLFATRLIAQGQPVTLRTDDSAHCRHSPETLTEASTMIMGN